MVECYWEHLIRYLLAAIIIVWATAALAGVGAASINNGGSTTTGGGVTMISTLGQSVAGFTSAPGSLHWAGFWSGDIPSANPLARVSSANQTADGSYISLVGKVATTGAADFNGFFYVEELDRSAGIRVSVPTRLVAGLLPGCSVNVIGTLRTAALASARYPRQSSS